LTFAQNCIAGFVVVGVQMAGSAIPASDRFCTAAPAIVVVEHQQQFTTIIYSFKLWVFALVEVAHSTHRLFRMKKGQRTVGLSHFIVI
jgi:hypothetical protein